MGCVLGMLSYGGMPPWCLTSGAPAFCACSVAVRASILRSSSATRLSAFFWRFRVGGVVMLGTVSYSVATLATRRRTKGGLPLRIACTTRLGVPGRSAPSAHGTSRMRGGA